MNYRRKLEMARAAAPQTEVVPAQDAEPAVSPKTDFVEEEPEVIEIEAPEVVAEVLTENEDPSEMMTPEAEAELSDDEAAENTELLYADASEDAESESSEDAEPEAKEVSMTLKKEDLLEIARKRGVQVSARATKAAIIEAIEKASEDTES